MNRRNKLYKTCFHRKQVFLLLVTLSLFFLRSNQTEAQSINLADSLRNVLKNKPSPTIKIDTRNSFITGQSARILGVKLGLSFGKRLSFGVGYNWLQSEINEPIDLPTGTVVGLVKMKYIAPFIDYSFYKKGHWEANVPVQIGFGRSYVQLEKSTGRSHVAMGSIMLYEPTMIVEYKVLNLIGLGGGIGYRIMLKNNELLNQQFSSPVYVLRFRVIFDELLIRSKERERNLDE